MFDPAGLRILVVDDDPLCLGALQRMLIQCHYTVATCDTVNKALAMLREGGFDIVMSEAYLPDGDGFKLLEKIGLELDLPVIMMSSKAETAIVMKGIIHGACDYLVKPIRMQELRNIWQHVVRRMGQKLRMGGEEEEDEEDIQIIQSPAEGFGLKKRKDQVVNFSSNSEAEQLVDDVSGFMKARVIWSAQLHKQFVKAVNELGVDNAMPKRIVEIMNVQGLTRENVASHLQKYRLYLKRVSGLSDASSPVASFQASKDRISARTRRLNLVSLSEYNTQQQQHVANRAQVLGALGLVDSKQISHKGFTKPPYSPLSSSSSSSFSSLPGLHRMCSLDLQNFLTAHPEEMSMEQTFSHSSNFAFKMGNSKLPTKSQKSLHKKGTKESASTSRWVERTYSGSHIQELTEIRSLMLASLENKATDIVKMEPIQESASSFVSKSVDSSCASSNISQLSATFSSIPLLTEEGMKDDALSMVNLNSFASLVLPDTCAELVPGTPLDVSDYVIDDVFFHNGF